jgi:hypothetical protein
MATQLVLPFGNSPEEVLQIEDGSLYPALHRMEEAGWIKAKWITKETGGRSRESTNSEVPARNSWRLKKRGGGMSLLQSIEC